MVSSIDIKRMAKEIEKEHNLNYYEILQRYMFRKSIRTNFLIKLL